MPDTTPLLHIHAQDLWHADAYIVGNREGLARLRAAIDTALEQGAGQAEAFVSDGEGFNAMVCCDDSAWESPSWTGAALPYTDPLAQGSQPNQQHPAFRSEWEPLRVPPQQ